ncbi:MAG: TonB-dependent receptor, partial [Terriglobales bacterium]
HQDKLQTRINKYFGFGNQLSGLLALTSTRSSGANLFGFLDDTSTLGWNASLNWRHSFTRTLYATFGYDYSRQATQSLPFFAGRTDVEAAAGIAGPDDVPLQWGPPTLTFSNGIAALNDGLYAHNRNQTGAVSASAYWNHQAHNITFGGDYRRLEFNDFGQQNPRGSFTFNGAATGDALTDFLGGEADAASLSFGNADKYFRETTNDLFFNDDWRASDTVSLVLGARFEFSGPVSERYGRLVNLATGSAFASATPVLGVPPTADYAGLEPRLGLAWRPFLAGSLLIRSGYGIYRDSSLYQAIALAMATQAPLATSLNVAAAPGAPLTLATALTTAPGATPDTFAIDPNFRVGYAQDWNASLQQDLPDGMVMTLSYLGTKGTRGVQRFYPNTYAPGAANPCPACPVGYLYETSGGNSTDESGTALLQRRFHNGLAFSASYTYAHAIDDAALGGGAGATAAVVAQNWLDLAAERARSDFDQRHKFSFTSQYSSGAGRGGWLMRAWRRPLFGGWTLTTILTAGSGLPLTPTLLAIIPGTGFTGLRPNATGASPGAAPAGLYVNPAAFALPARGAWGTAGRNSIEGPSQFSLNASLQREFPLPRGLDSTLRVDATNVLNHGAFSSYNTLVGSALFGLPTAAGAMRSLQTTYRITF